MTTSIATTSIAIAGTTPCITTVRTIAARFKDFTNAYKIALLWASTDEQGEPLDTKFSIHGLSHAACILAEDNCISFLVAAEKHGFDLLASVTLAEQAGHDFWMTRNHHGAGFWDRPEVYGGQAAADLLTTLSHTFGEQDPYVSDNGQIELQ